MARIKSQPLNEWRSYFATAVDTDIFSIIDHAIKVAASDHPQDFNLRKDRIVERLSSIRCLRDDEESHDIEAADQGSKESDAKLRASDEEVVTVLSRMTSQDVKEEILKMIKEVFENNDEKDNESLLNNSLIRLAMLTMSVEILEATEIGKVVNGLRNHKSKDIRDISRGLVRNWKDLVNRQFPTQSCEKQASNSTGEKKVKVVRIKIIKKKQEGEDVKPNNVAANNSEGKKQCSNDDEGVKPDKKAANNSGDKKQCSSDETAVEAKIESTKRKLHDRYEQIENQKKQRKVQVLNEHELPKQGGRLQTTAANPNGKKPGKNQGRKPMSKLQKIKEQLRR